MFSRKAELGFLAKNPKAYLSTDFQAEYLSCYIRLHHALSLGHSGQGKGQHALVLRGQSSECADVCDHPPPGAPSNS